MRVGRVVYWFVTGACLGLGLAPGALGIFLVAGWASGNTMLLAIGVLLLLIGTFALRGREAVATVLGLGAGPAALFAYIEHLRTWMGPADSFVYGGLVISILVALIGLVALVVAWRAQRRGVGSAAS